MKKLNEDIIRKLIIETIDEVALGEGRKKKLEEADPEIDPVEDAEGMAALQQPTPQGEVNPNQPGPAPGIETIYITDKEIQDFNNAAKALKSKNDVEKIGAETILKNIADRIKEMLKNTDPKTNK